MANTSIENKILDEFQCPVCREYMSPPVLLCAIGHSICRTCFRKCNRCPICRGEKSYARNYTLERICAKLTFPCVYSSEGCTFSDKGILIKEHEKFCKYSVKECPLNINNYCHWSGKVEEFIDHCKEKHPRDIYPSNRQEFKCRNFKELNCDSYFCVLMQAHGDLFRIVWYNNVRRKVMKWCVYQLGKPNDSKTFSYHVSIGSNYNERINLGARCVPWSEGAYVLEDDSFFSIYTDMLSKYCCKNGAIHYIVEIIDQDMLV